MCLSFRFACLTQWARLPLPFHESWWVDDVTENKTVAANLRERTAASCVIFSGSALTTRRGACLTVHASGNLLACREPSSRGAQLYGNGESVVCRRRWRCRARARCTQIFSAVRAFVVAAIVEVVAVVVSSVSCRCTVAHRPSSISGCLHEFLGLYSLACIRAFLGKDHGFAFIRCCVCVGAGVHCNHGRRSSV